MGGREAAGNGATNRSTKAFQPNNVGNTKERMLSG